MDNFARVLITFLCDNERVHILNMYEFVYIDHISLRSTLCDIKRLYRNVTSYECLSQFTQGGLFVIVNELRF